jgi:hypothetical protein
VRRAAALLAGVLALTACASPAPPSTVAHSAEAATLTAWLDAAQAEVQAVHEALVEARRRRDIEASLAVRAEGFVLVAADGSQRDLAAFEAALRSFDARLLEMGPGTGLTIDRIEDWSPRRPWESEGEVLLVLRVRQRLVGQYQFDDGPQAVAWETQVRETWRRTPEGWRQVRVEELAE